MRSTTLALALSLSAVAVLAPTASAQAPDPGPCPGTVFAADAAGDQKLYGQIPAPSSTDIVDASFRQADKKSQVTINLTTLDKTVPANSTGLSWYLQYTLDGAALFVSAELKPDGTVVYSTGTDGQSYTPTGTTKGQFIVGTPGKIVIDVPGIASTRTTTLSATSVLSYEAIGADIPGVGSAAFLPGADSAAGDDITVTPCSTLPPPA